MNRSSILLGASALVLAVALLPKRAETAPPDSYGGQRPFLSSLSAADQATLAKLIDEYTSANNGAVIKVHENTMNDPKLSVVHYRPFTKLFTFHHAYITGLEDWLKANGHSNFVPLPKWDPSTPIPKEFGYHNGKKVIKNFHPKVSWSAFTHDKLGAFVEDITTGPKDTNPDAKILANTLVVPHNNTHNTVGGIMSTMSSPTAPIFWVYHAFIDDIWYDWQQVQKEKPKGGLRDELEAPDPNAVRSIQAKVQVDKDGNVTLAQVGTDDTFPVTAEPWKSILAEAKDRTLWVQAKVDNGSLDVQNLVSANESMGPIKVHSGAALDAPQTGTLTGMSEIHITGEKGKFWKVRLDDDGKDGWVAKSVVKLGKSSDDSSMNMPGMPGMSMPNGGHGGSAASSSGSSSESSCACCGTGSSCTCCGSSGSCSCGMDEHGATDEGGKRSGMTDGVNGTHPDGH
jgi:hypothetical protein